MYYFDQSKVISTMILPSGQQILIFFIFLLIGWIPGTVADETAAAPARAVPEMITDRPDATESPNVVPTGYAQIEAGWNHVEFEQDGVELTSDAFPSTLVRIGLHELVELRVGFDGYLRQDQPSAGSVSGFGNSSIGAKFSLATEKRTEAAVIAQLNLESGDPDVRALRNDPAVIFTFANTLTERLSLGYNIGVRWTTVEDTTGDEDTLSALAWTIALGIDGKGRWAYFTEFFGATGLSEHGSPANLFDGGVTYLLRPNLQLDLAVGVGLSSAAPDWITTLGISYRFPR